MHETRSDLGNDSEARRSRPEAIKQFLKDYAPSDNHELFSQMLVTMCRLAADDVDRGDLKILNTTLKELRYAFKIFAPYAGTRKVSIFGSARTSPTHPQYLAAKSFAELIQQHGWMVITGAGDGIMRAGHHGATRESSFGVAISLPFEQSTNDVIANDPKLVNFKYFFTRKLVFVKEADAIVLFPGGFGTQDEGFEALTLVQTIKTTPMPVVMCDEPGGSYWRRWRDYVEKELLGNGMVDPEDMGLFHITDQPDEAVEEVTRFYRRYHSSRHVGDDFVMRLNSPLSGEALDTINSLFKDIVTQGEFTQADGPLRGEESAFPEKPRLVFVFDRRASGRLRMLINWMNDND